MIIKKHIKSYLDKFILDTKFSVYIEKDESSSYFLICKIIGEPMCIHKNREILLPIKSFRFDNKNSFNANVIFSNKKLKGLYYSQEDVKFL